MADKTRVINVHLQINDLTANYYQHLHFKSALGDHETGSHFVLKLLGYALMRQPNLHLINHKWHHDEPDIKSVDYDQHVILWLDAELPEQKRLRHACQLADHVVIVARQQPGWQGDYHGIVQRYQNVSFYLFESEFIDELVSSMSNRLNWTVNIELDQCLVVVGDGDYSQSYSCQFVYIPEGPVLRTA